MTFLFSFWMMPLLTLIAYGSTTIPVALSTGGHWDVFLLATVQVSRQGSSHNLHQLGVQNMLCILPRLKHKTAAIREACYSLSNSDLVGSICSGSEQIQATITRKLCYRKDDRAMRLIYECPEFLNVQRKFEMRSLSRS